MKYTLAIFGCLLLISCGSEENSGQSNSNVDANNLTESAAQDVATNGKPDIQTKIEKAKNHPDNGENHLNPAGQVLFSLSDANNPADRAIHFFKNFISCKMPTTENPTLALEATKAIAIDTPSVKVSGTTASATLEFDLGEGQTFRGTGKVLGGDLDELGFYLTLQPDEGSTATKALSLTGGYFCPR